MAPNDPVRIVEITDDAIDEIAQGVIDAGVAEPGDRMDLVNAPNATAITAIQVGLATPGDQMDLVDAPNALAVAEIQNGLANAVNLAAVDADTSKIDDVATNGLDGVVNSLAYRVGEIERHLHSGGRWFETASVPNGEIHVADSIGSGGGAFQMDAGNNTWGNWVQILGSSDTPTVVGKAYFDPHQFIIEDTERAATYFIRMARGDSGAAGLAAGTYTEFVYSATVQKETGIIPVQTGRAPAGSKLWIQCMVPGVDTGTMDFFFGLHEYEG